MICAVFFVPFFRLKVPLARREKKWKVTVLALMLALRGVTMTIKVCHVDLSGRESLREHSLLGSSHNARKRKRGVDAD